MSSNYTRFNSKDRTRCLRLLGSLVPLLDEVQRDALENYAHEFLSNLVSFYARIVTVFLDPAQLAPIFLDFCSLLHSLWDEKRSGPSFIAPMSSLTKRPSGRLSRLLLQHSRDLPQYEPDESSSQGGNFQTVAVIHFSKVPEDNIKADLHGLMSLLIFIETLIFVLLPSWPNRAFAFVATVLVCAYAIISGDGTLTLIRASEETHDTSAPSCALLLGEDLTVVVKGPELVIEAVTNGGFHLSRTFVDLLQRPAWNIARDATLEGFFEGLFYSMALLLVRLLGLLPWSPLLLGLLLTTPSWKTFCRTLWTVSQLLRGPDITAGKLVEAMKPAAVEFFRMTARGIPFGGFLLLCMYTSAENYVPRLGDLVQFALLVNLLPFVSLATILSVPSQDYPLQAAKVLDVLGDPLVKKWRFRSPAAAATFQCLVLCDGLDHPTKDINVRGVLDTLILDQRDFWGAWKARVADRIAYEEHISFSPTIPTFREAGRQTELEGYLDEAQRAYQAYERYRNECPSDASLQVPQHST